MALTNKKINFFNTDLSTFLSHSSDVKDGSLFFINDGNGHGGRLYNGSNLVANVGFEEFSISTTGTGSFITGITPSSSVADDGTLSLGLTLSTGNPDKVSFPNNYGQVAIAAASSAVTNQSGISLATIIGPNTTTDTLTFTPGNKWLTIYGTGNGDDIKISHQVNTISGGSAGTLYGPTAAVTVSTNAASASTISVPQIKVDEAGHVTQVNHYTLTLQDNNTANAALGAKSGDNIPMYIASDGTPSSSNATSTITFTQGTDMSLTRSSNTLTVAHATKTATAGTDTAMTILPGESKTFTHVSNLGTISNGHVTGTYKTQAVTVDLTGLANVIHYKGSVDVLPVNPYTGYAVGDVVALRLTNKEYILDSSSASGTTGWREFGDEGSYAVKTRKVLGDGTYLEQSGTGELSSDVTISHKTSGVTAGSYGTRTMVPSITVDAAGHITDVTTLAITNSRDPGYGKITPANNTNVITALTGNTTQLAAATYNENFKFEAANKWLTVAGTNGTSGNDVLKIAHSAPGTPTADTSTKNLDHGDLLMAITAITTDEAQHITGYTTTTFFTPENSPAYIVANSATATQTNLQVSSTANGAYINVFGEDDAPSSTTAANKHSIKLTGTADVSVSALANGEISIGHTSAFESSITDDPDDPTHFYTLKVDSYGHVIKGVHQTPKSLGIIYSEDPTFEDENSRHYIATHMDFTDPSEVLGELYEGSVLLISHPAPTQLELRSENSSYTLDFCPVWQTL